MTVTKPRTLIRQVVSSHKKIMHHPLCHLAKWLVCCPLIARELLVLPESWTYKAVTFWSKGKLLYSHFCQLHHMNIIKREQFKTVTHQRSDTRKDWKIKINFNGVTQILLQWRSDTSCGNLQIRSDASCDNLQIRWFRHIFYLSDYIKNTKHQLISVWGHWYQW